MKKLNSTAEFEQQRRRFLLENFRASIASQSEIAVRKAFHDAAGAPAPRFWVSEARAAAVIGKILAGDNPTAHMLPEKRDMYEEIFSRFAKIRLTQPHRTIADIIFEVVNDPAPRSYMSWQRARSIIYKERQRIRRERLAGKEKAWK